MAFCKHCGKQISNEQARFCSGCGKPRIVEPPAAPVNPMEESAPWEPVKTSQVPVGGSGGPKPHAPPAQNSTVWEPPAPTNPPPGPPPAAMPERDSAVWTTPDLAESAPDRAASVIKPPFPVRSPPLQEVRPPKPDPEQKPASPPPPLQGETGKPVQPRPKPDPDAFYQPRVPGQGSGTGKVSTVPTAARPGRKKGLVVALAVALALAAGFGGTWGYFAWRASPSQFLQRLDQALVEQDEPALRAMFIPEGDYTITPEELLALSAALLESDVRTGFRQSLEVQMEGASGSRAFSAFVPEKESVLKLGNLSLFEKRVVRMLPVEILLYSNVADIELNIGFADMRVSASDGDGVRITALPGVYEITGRIRSGYNTVQPRTDSMRCLSADEVYTAELVFPVFDIAVACGEVSDLTVYINDNETSLKPEGKTVLIPFAEEGMEIRGEAWQNDVPVTSQFVVGSAEDSYAFAFGAGQEESGMSTEELVTDYGLYEIDVEVADDLFEYYDSYVEAINEQDPGKLRQLTDSYLPVATEWVSANQDYLFSLITVIVDMDTFTYHHSRDGSHRVQVNLHFEYEYRGRSDAGPWSVTTSPQICHLIFDEGRSAWLVENIEIDESVVMGRTRLRLTE